jgi:hypothetical protein
VKKLLYVVAFVSSTVAGAAACGSELKEACEDFISARDACEALTPPDPEDKQIYFTNVCANIDPDCREFYECAVLAYNPDFPDTDFCEEDSKGKFRLNIRHMNEVNEEALGEAYVECKEPENKACTDADLRP